MIKTEEPHLLISAASHAGMTGKQNEDRYLITSFLTEHRDKTPSVLAVLCDGIGGHRAGEVAAEMGVTLITETIAGSDAQQPLRTMAAAITHANDAIFTASLADYGHSGMGTTCACVWVIDNQLYTANIGDSRIYLLRDRHFFQLSTDHTWIQEAIDAGLIKKDDSGNHPNAHVIRRYLGSKTPPEPDFRLWVFEGENNEDALKNQGLRLLPDDILMLCTDGLTDLVTDEEIQQVILNQSFEEVPPILIAKANRRGGHDNTSIVLMKTPSKKNSHPKRRWAVGCLAALAIVILFAATLLFGLHILNSRINKIHPSPSITVTLPNNTPTPFPTINHTSTMIEEGDTPYPSITPWPTDTPSP